MCAPLEFEIVDGVLKKYRGTAKDIIIPEDVVRIDSNAFWKNEIIESVRIHGNTDSIGDKAFYWCKNLHSVTIEEGVKKIGAQAFCMCGALYDLSIPNSIATVGVQAFQFTPWISEYVDNSKEELVVLGDVLIKYLGSDSVVVIPEGIRLIETEAFRDNESLAKVVFPNSLTQVAPAAFRDCINLKEAVVNERLEFIGSLAFAYCYKLESIELPESVTTIGASAFVSCESLERVVLPSKVKMVPSGGKIRPFDGPFNGCSKLLSAGPKGSGKDIEFTWDECIPMMAFFGLRLTEVDIPENISSIGSYAFRRGNKRHGYEYNGTDFVPVSDTELVVTMPYKCEVSEDSFDDDVFIKFSTRISSSEKIGKGIDCFTNTRTINNLTDDELAWILLYQSKKWRTSIYEYIDSERALSVLKCCNAVLERTKKVTKTQGISMLELLNKREKKQSYTEEAAELKDFLRRKKSEAAELIDDNKDDKRVEEIVKKPITENGTEIGDGDYYETPYQKYSQLDKLPEWPILSKDKKDFKIKKENILREYVGKKSVLIVPEGIVEIGSGGCVIKEGVTEVIMPDTVVAIHNDAFVMSKDLVKVIFSPNITHIGARAFGYTKVKEIILPDVIEEIDDMVFYCCKSLEEVILPRSVRVIGNGAFQSCDSIKKIVISDEVEKIGKNAFFDKEATYEWQGIKNTYFAKDWDIRVFCTGNGKNQKQIISALRYPTLAYALLKGKLTASEGFISLIKKWLKSKENQQRIIVAAIENKEDGVLEELIKTYEVLPSEIEALKR